MKIYKVVMYTAPDTRGVEIYKTKQLKRAFDKMFATVCDDNEYTKGVIYQEERTWNEINSYTFKRMDWIKEKDLWDKEV